jgi:hypothetical protein
MNLKHLILPTVALGAAAGLLIPTKSDAFSTIGGNLSTSQRDFRIFDNFTDAAANNNTTADANWPGYTGVELAIWKACVEWASSLHGGNGNGDPHQNAGLGSGGANFDPVFQGNATGVGTSNGNTHSELAGGDGGVLAFTETPISDGWRIRYYATWNWADGPTTNPGGTDIQGVACHEYGHALGLGHSTTNGATMFPSISGSGVAQRSIAADDIAGVQSIYGVVAGSKPTINSIAVNAGILTINGVNFGATNNQVWFTPDTATSADVPVIVSGLSSNGTVITVTAPAAAGPGDVFVKLSSSGHASLSNGFPVDPGAIVIAPTGVASCFGDGSVPTPCPCAPPDSVPFPSGASDAGCANWVNLDGAKLVGDGDVNPDLVVLTCTGEPSTSFSIFLCGDAQNTLGQANGDGVLCVTGALVRFGSQFAVGGTITYPNPSVGLTNPLSTATGVTPGSGVTRHIQVYYRNALDGFCSPGTTNLSNMFSITWTN